MTKKISRTISVIMIVIAICFIFFALNNPQASFPWNSLVTYILYTLYLAVMLLLFIAPFKK